MPENQAIVFDEEETRAFREASTRYEDANSAVVDAERALAGKMKEFQQVVDAMPKAQDIEHWDPYRSGLVAGAILALRDCHRAVANALEDQALAIGGLNTVLCALQEKVLSHAKR